MNYPLKPKQRRDPKLKRSLIAVVVTLAIILIIYAIGSNVLFGILGPIGTPIWKTRQAVSNFIGSNISLLKSKETLLEENSNLKLQLGLSNAITLERDALLLENESLKGITNGKNETGEIAAVLSNPVQSIYDIVSVELGLDSQVRVGDVVYGQSNIVLGTVVERSGNLARIKYFSSSGSETEARIGKDGSEFTLKGQGGGNFVFVAPRDFKVKTGDVVLLPAYNMNIIGMVNAVETPRSDSFKNVYISYPISIFNLGFVRISRPTH
jgi:cell shape-determining protein MreC